MHRNFYAFRIYAFTWPKNCNLRNAYTLHFSFALRSSGQAKITRWVRIFQRSLKDALLYAGNSDSSCAHSLNQARTTGEKGFITTLKNSFIFFLVLFHMLNGYFLSVERAREREKEGARAGNINLCVPETRADLKHVGLYKWSQRLYLRTYA